MYSWGGREGGHQEPGGEAVKAQDREELVSSKWGGACPTWGLPLALFATVLLANARCNDTHERTPLVEIGGQEELELKYEYLQSPTILTPCLTYLALPG